MVNGEKEESVGETPTGATGTVALLLKVANDWGVCGRIPAFGRVGALRRSGRRNAASLSRNCLKTERRTF